MRTVDQHRTRELRAITTAFALICTTACATAAVPGLENLMTWALALVAVLAVLAGLARRCARWVRERREDREDAVAAEIWRAQHTDRPVSGLVREVA